MRTLNKRAQGALAAAMGLAFSVSALAADITGAGATFPYAVYTKWAEAYKSATGNQGLLPGDRLVGRRQSDQGQDC